MLSNSVVEDVRLGITFSRGGKGMERPNGRPELSRVQVLVMALVFEGGLLVLWIVLSSALGMPTSSQGRTGVDALYLGLAGTAPLLPALWFLSRSSLTAVRRLIRTVDDLLVPVLQHLSLPDMVLISLLAGVGEEGLFRGILQGYLAGIIGDLPALGAAAALFGLLHFITPLYAILAGVMGLYLGWLYMATGNLLVPMIVHGLYDFIAIVYLVRIRQRSVSTGGEGRGEE